MRRLIFLMAFAALTAAPAACTFDPGGLSYPSTVTDGGLEAPDGRPSGADATPVPDAGPPPADAGPPDADPNACPTSYLPDPASGSSYRFVTSYANWPSAEADCENDGNGTHLVVIDDADELGRVAAVIGPFQAWIGLTDRKHEGEFVWVTGEEAELSQLPWKAGEPNDSGGEDCAEQAGEELNDEDCDLGFNQYVCECDGLPADKSAF